MRFAVRGSRFALTPIITIDNQHIDLTTLPSIQLRLNES